MVGHDAQRAHVILVESGLLGGLSVQYPQEPPTHYQRLRHLRTGVGKEWVGEVDRVLPHVSGDAGLVTGCGPADHRVVAHRQPVSLGLHLLPDLTGRLLQHCPLTCFIYQEYASVVEAEAIADQIHRLAQQLVHIEDRSDGPTDLGAGLQLHSPPPESVIGFLERLGALDHPFLRSGPLDPQFLGQFAAPDQGVGQAGNQVVLRNHQHSAQHKENNGATQPRNRVSGVGLCLFGDDETTGGKSPTEGHQGQDGDDHGENTLPLSKEEDGQKR